LYTELFENHRICNKPINLHTDIESVLQEFKFKKENDSGVWSIPNIAHISIVRFDSHHNIKNIAVNINNKRLISYAFLKRNGGGYSLYKDESHKGSHEMIVKNHSEIINEIMSDIRNTWIEREKEI